MLKNKMVGRKIRNIIILLMVIVIMFGAYRNINRSRAEKVEKVKAVALDKYGYLEKELFTLEAKQIEDDLYEIQLPEDINTKIINRIVNVTLEDYVPEEVVSENAIKQNASTENEVTENTGEGNQSTENTDSETPVEEIPATENSVPEETTQEETTTQENPTPEEPTQEETTTPENPAPEEPVQEEATTPENPAPEETTTPENPTPEEPVQEETTTPEETTPDAPAQEEATTPENPTPEEPVQEDATIPENITIQTPVEDTITENVTEESNVLEIVENKIYLTKQQLEEKQINIEVVYDIVLLTKNSDNTFNKTPLAGKNAEEISQIVKTEGVQLLYYKALKFEDEKNSKLVELKGYLPVRAELQVEDVTIDKLHKELQKEVVPTGEQQDEELLEEPHFFTEENVEVAYNIKILNKIVEKTPADEADPLAKPEEVVETIEINPGDYREACEVTIKDTKIGKNSKVYYIREDKGYEQVSIKNNSKEGNISFETYEFSTFVVANDTLNDMPNDIRNEISFDDSNVGKTETTYASETQPAYIPEGYRHVSGTTMANGYVIENINNGNQFVWIEVPKSIYTTSTRDLNLNNLSGTALTNAYDTIESELNVYTNPYYYDQTEDSWNPEVQDGFGFEKEEDYYELKYKMLKSIFTYGGFYVGRYETGIMEGPRTAAGATSQTPVIKKSAYPYNYVTHTQAQGLASGNDFAIQGYETSLLFNIQWSLMLKYIETKEVEKGKTPNAIKKELTTSPTTWGNNYNVNRTLDDDNAKYWTSASGWKTGKYNGGTKGDITTSVLLSTGASYSFAKQNIYDISGNISELSLGWSPRASEMGAEGSSMSRGGYFKSENSSALLHLVFNDDNYNASAENYVGFRVALYKDSVGGGTTGPSTLKSTFNETTSASGFLGNTAIAREDIESVTFLNSTSGAPARGTWDVSAAGDGSIIAWYTGTNPYQVYIASNVQIKANADSRYLFAYIGSGENCTATSVINNIHLLDTSETTDMQAMFQYCGYNAMTTLDLGSNFDTSKVTNMGHMFQWCGHNAMTTLDLGDEFDTSKVTGMYAMFGDCGRGAMTSLNLGNKFNTCNVTDMSAMFMLCGRTAMTNLNLGNNFDTSKVTNMYLMFYQCGASNFVLELGDKFDTSKVTNMVGMFSACYFSSLDLGDKFDTSNVTNMDSMFAYAGSNSLRTLDLGDKFNTSKVTNMYMMFYMTGTSSLETLDMGPLFTKIPDGTVTGTTLKAYGRFVTDLGKEGCIIYCPDQIFENNHAFKLSADSTTTIPYTRGTINPGNGGGEGEEPTPTPDTEKPIWNFVSARYEETDGSAVIVISGTDNELLSSSSLKASDLTIWINSTKIDSSRITVGQAIQLGDGRGGVKYPITISNYTGGNVVIGIPAEKLIDNAGNKSNQQNITIPPFYTAPIPETETDKPEVRYVYSDTDIDRETKTLTVTFSIVDKNFKSSSLNVEDLVITIDGKNIEGKGVTKEFTKIEDKLATVDGKEKVIGKEYTLLISNIEKVIIDPGDIYANYSGVVTVTVPANVAEDESGNKNDKTEITVGINITGEDFNDKIVIGGGGNGNNDEEEDTGSYATASDLLAAGKLKIGDFVNYDAGTWTQEEINAIKVGPTSSLVTANGSTSLPTQNFQFGGFAAGSSRNGNATSALNNANDYLTDETGNKVTGWRVFDIADDGTVTLISAGNPEDYNNVTGTTNGYINEYILSGNINTNWTGANTSVYQKRDWNDYVNSEQRGKSATILTKTTLDEWYIKYTDTDSNQSTYTDEVFRKIYSNPYLSYQNIIDNYSRYGLVNPYSNSLILFNPAYLGLTSYIDRNCLYGNSCPSNPRS